MTREECLEYRSNCPYDAMGDYSVLIEEDRAELKETDTHFQTEVPHDK